MISGKALLLFMGGFLGGVFLPSCGNQFGVSSGSGNSGPDETAGSAPLNLFERSPGVDNGNVSQTASLSINSLNRRSVTLYDMHSKKRSLEGARLRVFNNESERRAPIYNDFVNRNPDFDSDEFKTFMAYAHLSRSIRDADRIFTGAHARQNFSKVYPLEAFSREPGHPLSTGYIINFQTSGSQINVNRARISFFQDRSNAQYGFYNTVDESDAIYHEFGHVVQRVFNERVEILAESQDLGMILEALSDYYAAASLTDAQILRYLEANSPNVFSSNGRTGNRHTRNAENRLFFPDSYLNHEHLDGRVLAATLNDFRKYLQGQVVSLTNCSSGSCQVHSPGVPQSLRDSFEIVLRIVHNAFADLVLSSSMHQFSSFIVNETQSGNQLGAVCSSSACSSSIASHFQQILIHRGLMANTTQRPLVSNIQDIANIMTFTHEMGFIGFSETGQANNDNLVQPCEILLVYPKFTNTSNSQSTQIDLMNLDISIVANGDGTFPQPQEVSRASDSTIIDFLSPGDSQKVFGWIKPGESSDSLMKGTTSGWFDSQQNATLMRPLSGTHFPVGGGYIVRAPNSANTSASLTFQLRAQAQSSNSTFTSQAININQTLTTTSGTGFCN